MLEVKRKNEIENLVVFVITLVAIISFVNLRTLLLVLILRCLLERERLGKRP